MAKIVLGLGTSHAPQLSIPPESWPKRGNADRRYLKLWYQGQPYSFDELCDVRAASHFANELTAEKAKTQPTPAKANLHPQVPSLRQRKGCTPCMRRKQRDHRREKKPSRRPRQRLAAR